MYSVILSKSVHLLPRYYTFTQTYRKISLNTVTDTLKIQSGIFRSISESPPVDFLQKFLVNIHDSTGLPWWATIICTTIFLRSTITIPLAVYQNYILAKVYNVNKELAELSKELKKEVAIAIKLYQWDEKVAKYHYKRSLKKQWNKLIIRDNCHPVKASLLIWFQIPLWISFSVALRNLAYKLPESNLNNDIIYNQLSIEGFGWISNLTQIDPFFILPLTFGFINLGIIEIQSLSKTGPPTKFQKYVLNFFRGVTIFMVPVAAGVPSCITLYWATSSVYGLIQNLVLMSPKLKRFCNIPKTSVELEKPYTHILSGIKHKFASKMV